MNKYSITSYAQNFEDILLYRCFKDIEKGFYIDVGSMDPVNDSVTNLFYDIGWSGINIEASKKYFELISSYRKRDLNIFALASSKTGKRTFYDLENGLSSAIKPKSEFYNKTEIKSTTLDVIFNKAPADIHFLKIDVEGYEFDVLEGWKKSQKRPWVIIVENNYKTDNEVHQFLKHRDYSKVYFDGINSFYIHQNHVKRLSVNFHYPVGVQDSFRIHPYSSNSWCHYLSDEINQLKHEKTILENKCDALKLEIKKIKKKSLWNLLIRKIYDYRK